MPSLNLRWKQSNELQYRFALGTGISRPDFSQLQAQTTLNQGLCRHDRPELRRDQCDQRDADRLGGWQPDAQAHPLQPDGPDGRVVLQPHRFADGAVFHKQLKDVIINQTSIIGLPDSANKIQDFVVTSPINGAKGTASGVELAFQTYFDMLPGAFSGLGMQANYTYVNSKTKLYAGEPGLLHGRQLRREREPEPERLRSGRPHLWQPAAAEPVEERLQPGADVRPGSDLGAHCLQLAPKYLQNVNVNGTQGGDAIDTNPSSPTKGQTNVAWALPTWADGFTSSTPVCSTSSTTS